MEVGLMTRHPYVITEIKCDQCSGTLELVSTFRTPTGARSIFRHADDSDCDYADHLDFASEEDYHNGNPILDPLPITP
jgi:hypothetical protein